MRTITTLFLLLQLSILVLGLAGRGSKSSLTLTHGRSHNGKVLHAQESVTIWCAPDNPQVVIQNAHFIRDSDKSKLEATLNPTKKNATYTFGNPTVRDAGEYRCEMDTLHGKLTTRVFIYARPIAHSDDEFKLKGNNEFQLISDMVLKSGDTVNLTCPVIGYPTPVVSWKRDGAPLALNKSVSMIGSKVLLSNIDSSAAGVYSCEALNEYTVNGKTTKSLITLERKISVKNEYQWILPLVVIAVTLILLLIIIFACELRKNNSSSSKS